MDNSVWLVVQQMTGKAIEVFDTRKEAMRYAGVASSFSVHDHTVVEAVRRWDCKGNEYYEDVRTAKRQKGGKT